MGEGCGAEQQGGAGRDLRGAPAEQGGHQDCREGEQGGAEQPENLRANIREEPSLAQITGCISIEIYTKIL